RRLAATIENPQRLPLAPRDGAGWTEPHARAQAERASESFGDERLEPLAAGLWLAQLRLHCQLVEVPGALDDKLVMRSELRDREERALDLAREDVDATDEDRKSTRLNS